MAPKLTGVDHLHINVKSWHEAEKWYGSVLNFKRVDALMGWAVKNGPLTIENPEGTIHLALFEADNSEPTDVFAFGATGFVDFACRSIDDPSKSNRRRAWTAPEFGRYGRIGRGD